MTQEDKDLLLKDLCARLPYNTMIHGVYTYKEFYYITESDQITFSENDSVLTASDIEWIEMGSAEIKPYLFPMSSMTEEQKKELKSLMICDSYNILYHTIESFDYLYKNHIDVRGLIEKGLAIDCTHLKSIKHEKNRIPTN